LERGTLTVIHGSRAGETFLLDRQQVLIGRDATAHIRLEDPAISRCHALVERLPDGHYVLMDLGSTNGTFVAGHAIVRAGLALGARIQLGPRIVLRFSVTDEAEEALQRSLYLAATRDALTSLLNRRSLLDRLEIEVSSARRANSPLCALVMDLDGFKAINDSLGHLRGDDVLRAVALRIAAQFREEEALARYGGDEFVALVRSSVAGATRLAERLRECVAAAPYEVAGTQVRATLSMGIASLGECLPDAGSSALLALADARLYRAKLAGRNRICFDG
jgi:diguanylate cyclase (GGDEF)-like protein